MRKRLDNALGFPLAEGFTLRAASIEHCSELVLEFGTLGLGFAEELLRYIIERRANSEPSEGSILNVIAFLGVGNIIALRSRSV